MDNFPFDRPFGNPPRYISLPRNLSAATLDQESSHHLLQREQSEHREEPRAFNHFITRATRMSSPNHQSPAVRTQEVDDQASHYSDDSMAIREVPNVVDTSVPQTPRPRYPFNANFNPFAPDVPSSSLTGNSTPMVEKGEPKQVQETDAEEQPFEVHEHGHVELKSMHWIHAALIMIAETISLGILSLPSVLGTLGLIPGVIVILLMSVITTYTGYVLGQFKAKYPQVYSMADAGMILFGPIGRELFGLGQVLFLVFVMASHVLAFSFMMNVITNHGTCTIVFMVVGTVVSFFFTIPRTLKALSYFSIASFLSVIVAVVVIMISVGVGKKEIADIDLVKSSPIANAFTGVTNVAFAYAGHLIFFNTISEMKTPKDYPKALILLQCADTILYLATAVVIYLFVGPTVASPALSSTTKLISQIAYGLASPTIVISGVINGHVAAKYIIERMHGGTQKLESKSKSAYATWLLLCAALWIIAWVLAEAVPVFNNLLGLVSALFVSWFSFGINGMFWFHLNRDCYWTTKRKKFLTFVNAFMILTTFIVMGLGLYSSIWGIKTQAAGKIFSCANNIDLPVPKMSTADLERAL